MAMCNIPSTNTDPSYRYKMPRLLSKIEGRGNGIKTCIVNMTDVARALKRPPAYTTKFFGCELGAQSTFTSKEGEGDRAIVNGAHNTETFQKLLDKFIDMYVLCQNCHLPEIDMYVKKGIIQAGCKACGWRGDLDNLHKLAAYIQKNPPEGGVGFEGEGKEKKDKKTRQAEKAEKQKKGTKDDDDENDDDDDDEKKEKKEKKDKKEKKSKKVADGDDEDGEVKKEKKEKKEKKDKKEKKEKKDKKEKKEKKSKTREADSDEDGSDKKDSDDDVNELAWDEEGTEDVIKTMREFVSDKGDALNVADFFEELRMQQLAKVFDHKVRLFICLEALFPDHVLDKGMAGRAKYIKKVAENGGLKGPDFLWAFDTYLAANDGAEKKFAQAMKVVYDEDLVEEEPLIKHYKGKSDTPGFDKAKKAIAPFIEWLETAEESDSGEDS